MHSSVSPIFFQLSLLGISVLAGMFGAMLGLGGGFIIVPALTLLFGINFRYAVGASIVSVIATSSGAAASYVRDHVTNIRVAMLLEIGTTLGALAGVFLSAFLPERFLFLLLAALLIYSAFSMMRKRRDHHAEAEESSSLAKRLKLSGAYPDHFLNRNVSYGVTGVWGGLMMMLLAGVFSALLGIGSGTLKVPAMDLLMRLPIKVSSATSNFMIGVTAAASAGAYYMRGNILPILAAPVALGVLIGSWIGVRLMMKTKSFWLRKFFIVILLFIALQLCLYAFRSAK